MQRYKFVYRDDEGRVAHAFAKLFASDEAALHFARHVLPHHTSVEVTNGSVRVAFMQAETHFGQRTRARARRNRTAPAMPAWRRWLGLA